MSQIDVDTESPEYIAVKTEKVALPATWTRQLGNYKVINAFKSNTSQFNFTNASSKLFEEDGWCVLEIKTPGELIKYYLNIFSDKAAKTGGLGRQAGIIVKILDNGNLYFSGLELSKI